MPRRPIIAILLCLGVLFGGLAASALARRPAHGAQKERIIVAAGFSPHAPAGCYLVYVSTVNGNWATAVYGGSTQPPCAQYGSNGVVVLRYRAGRWRMVTEGSAFSCPIPGHIPAAVQRDLKLACAHHPV